MIDEELAPPMVHKEVCDRSKAYYLSAAGHSQLCRIAFDNFLKDIVGKESNAVWIAFTNNICFALEASLKSFLCLKGIDEKKLSSREYGHNLLKLYNVAIDNDLRDLNIVFREEDLSTVLGEIIQLFGKDYASFNYRYIEKTIVTTISQNSIEMVLACIDYLNEYLNEEIKVRTKKKAESK